MAEKLICTVEKKENGEVLIGGTDKDLCKKMFRGNENADKD